MRRRNTESLDAGVYSNILGIKTATDVPDHNAVREFPGELQDRDLVTKIAEHILGMEPNTEARPYEPYERST